MEKFSLDLPQTVEKECALEKGCGGVWNSLPQANLRWKIIWSNSNLNNNDNNDDNNNNDNNNNSNNNLWWSASVAMVDFTRTEGSWN